MVSQEWSEAKRRGLTHTNIACNFSFPAAIFARVKWRVENTASPLSFLRIMNLSGSYYLFLGQGLLVLLEVYFSSKFKSSKVYQRCKRNHLLSSIMSWLQSFWVYGSLTWMARWYIADIIPLMA